MFSFRLKQHYDVVVAFLLAIIFFTFPQFDIAFTDIFFDTTHQFIIGQQTWAQFLYHLVPFLAKIFIIALPLLYLASFIKFSPKLIQKNRKRTLYLLLVLVIGPGLVVNTLFKDQWHRARPINIEAFGGAKTHSPAFVISDQCKVNCSFVSGHASMGFFFMAFYWLGLPHKKRWLLFGLLFGLAIGAARIAQGGHFLSDVIFSGFSVYFVAKFLAFILKPNKIS